MVFRKKKGGNMNFAFGQENEGITFAPEMQEVDYQTQETTYEPHQTDYQPIETTADLIKEVPVTETVHALQKIAPTVAQVQTGVKKVSPYLEKYKDKIPFIGAGFVAGYLFGKISITTLAGIGLGGLLLMNYMQKKQNTVASA